MLFLHIIPPSKRMMNTFIDETRKHFVNDRHIFYFINKCPISEQILFKYEDVYELKGENKFQKIKNLNSIMKKADYIIWHGMTYSLRHVLFFSLPRYLKKSVWLMWGIDLYNWEKPNNGFRNFFTNTINRYWRTHIKHVISILPFDKDSYQKAFPKSKARIYNAPYPFSYETFETLNQLSNWRPRVNNKLFVQVAHNAHAFNNHLGILCSLEHFQNENLSLFIPLSYGPEPQDSKEYIQKVMDKVNILFPQKAYCLRKLMPLDAYSMFLWNMDIAIFDAPRQNALGNIIKQLYLGNKVFLTPKSPSYDFFKNLGIEIFNTEEIENMSFEEFSRMPQSKKAKSWVIETYHPECAMKKWDFIFEQLGGKSHINSFVEKMPVPIVPTIPIYKDIEPNIYKYLVWPFNVNKTKRYIIAGFESFSFSLLTHINSLQPKATEKKYLFLGFLCPDKEISTLKIASRIIGTFNTYNFKSDQVVFCTLKDGYERFKFFELAKEKGVSPASWTNGIISIGKSFYNYCILGEGCIFIGQQKINTVSFLGDGVILSKCNLGEGCNIGSFSNLLSSNIGAYAKIGCFSHISSGCSIGGYSILKKGVSFDSCVKISNNILIGSNVKVGAHAIIGLENSVAPLHENSTSLTKIGDNVVIGSHSSISNGVLINDYSRIDPSTHILENVTLGKNVVVGSYVDIEIGASIYDNVEIGVKSKIGAFSTINKGAKIGNYVKIGSFCTINEGVTILDGAELEDYVIINSGEIVGKGEKVVNNKKK